MGNSHSAGRTADDPGTDFPADGPIDALLGYFLLFVVFERSTPTLASRIPDAVPGITPGAVRFGLAAFLWFVLAVVIFEQARRQAVALGVVAGDGETGRPWTVELPASARRWAYLGGFLIGAAVAAFTFEPGLETVVALIEAVTTLDVASFPVVDFVVMVVFFVAFGVATRSLDRLVFDGIRDVFGR